MSVFGEYAACYDLVYRDKDYAGEASLADRLFQAMRPGTRDLLELGCGTGGHAILLAKHGYRVTGVDRSAEMLALAARRFAQIEPSVSDAVSLVESSIDKLALGRRFDAALAFFHVVSYLTKDRELADTFSGLRRHLKTGGLFLFDYWYEPAVLAQRPERREKVFEDKQRRVHRVMQPCWLVERRCVRIDIELTIIDKATGDSQTVEEAHLMRYFEPQELQSRLEANGFVVRRSSACMSDRPPDETTWGACLLAEAV